MQLSQYKHNDTLVVEIAIVKKILVGSGLDGCPGIVADVTEATG